MDLITTAHPEHPELDMSFSGKLLSAVAQGETPESMRIFRPGRTVAFGRLDRMRPGFDDARRVAIAHGMTPVLRHAGGHAAAYDSDSLIIEVFRRHDQGLRGLESRFIEMADLLQRAFAQAGVSLVLGELPGEYCPGRYSLHLPGGPKVVGIAQRVLTDASLTTAVAVVDGGEALRTVIAAVYEALELPLEVNTVGAVTDQYPEASCELVQQTLIDCGMADGSLQPTARLEA